MRLSDEDLAILSEEQPRAFLRWTEARDCVPAAGDAEARLAADCERSEAYLDLCLLNVARKYNIDVEPTYTRAERRTAALLCALYADPRLWLSRRVDVTEVVSPSRVSWRTTLHVRVASERLVKAELWEAGEPLVVPLLLEARDLLTGLFVVDHSGEVLATLPWSATRPLIERMLLGSAEAAVAATGSALDSGLRRALRLFSGDIGSVNAAREYLKRAERVGSAPSTEEPLPDRQQQQMQAIRRDPTMRLLLRDYSAGFIVMAQPRLRSDDSCELRITHDSAIVQDVLRMPVAACDDYQCEVHLPDGVAFRARPRLQARSPRDDRNGRDNDDSDEYSEISLGDERRSLAASGKGVREWAEVHGSLLAGYAPHQPRGRIWVLSVTASVRLAPGGLLWALQGVASLTAAMLVGGVIIHLLGVRPAGTNAASLVAVIPSAYAILLLQRSSSETLELVSQRPRRLLAALAGVTLAAAGTLAVSFPPGSPGLASFGWGWRGLVWCALTAACLVICGVLVVQLRRR